MSIHIRLMRFGKIKRPYYRIVALDSRRPRDGRYIENLGIYQPIESEETLKIDLEKYNEWLTKGAQVSNTVENLVKKFKKSGAQ